MNADKILDIAFASLSLACAIGIALVKAIGREGWEMGLLAACVTSLTVMLTKQQFAWKSHQQKVESALISLTSDLPSDQGPEGKLICRLLQSFTFGGSRIYDPFWVKFGQSLLNDSKANPASVIELVLAIKISGRVRSGVTKYEHMRVLFEEVDEYRGIAYFEELESADAQDFIFAIPSKFGRSKHIQRLFCVESHDSLRSLPVEKRQRLKGQIGEGVKLRSYVRQRGKWPENFGLYSDVAVGILDKRINTLDFNTSAVASHRTTWDQLWSDGVVLTVENLS